MLWVVSEPFWGCNEPPKVVILLRTSFTNHLLKQCAFKASSKTILKGFQTAASLQSEPQESSQGQSWTQLLVVLKLVDAPNSHHTAPEGLVKGFWSDFSRYLLVFHTIYASLGMTFCCLHSTWGTLRRAIHIHQLLQCSSHFTFDISFTYETKDSLICNSCFRSSRSNNKKPSSKQFDQESVVGNFGTALCNSLVHLRQFKACIHTDGRCGYIQSSALQLTSTLRDTLTVDTDFCWKWEDSKTVTLSLAHTHTHTHY